MPLLSQVALRTTRHANSYQTEGTLIMNMGIGLFLVILKICSTPEFSSKDAIALPAYQSDSAECIFYFRIFSKHNKV